MLDYGLSQLGFIKGPTEIGNVKHVLFLHGLESIAELEAWRVDDNLEWVIPRLAAALRLIRRSGDEIEKIYFGFGYLRIAPGNLASSFAFSVSTTYEPDGVGSWSLEEMIGGHESRTAWSRMDQSILDYIGSEIDL